jgi:hypothetical protein
VVFGCWIMWTGRRHEEQPQAVFLVSPMSFFLKDSQLCTRGRIAWFIHELKRLSVPADKGTSIICRSERERAFYTL